MIAPHSHGSYYGLAPQPARNHKLKESELKWSNNTVDTLDRFSLHYSVCTVFYNAFVNVLSSGSKRDCCLRAAQARGESEVHSAVQTASTRGARLEYIHVPPHYF